MPDAPYERQLFVCTYGAWCRLEGSEPIRARLKEGVKEAGLADRLRVTKCGCFGQCGNGPMAVLWPDNVWYSKLTLDDVPALLEHLKGGPPLEARRYHPPKAGTNKTEAVRQKEREKGTTIE